MAERISKVEAREAMRPIAFIDLEASGLGARSWPVEVGWAGLAGDVHAILVQPHPAWPEEAWDMRAEALHGLTRETLEQSGKAAPEICQQLNDALTDVDVYSDAVDWDSFWLYRLFAAAGVRQRFALKDFGVLMRPLAGRIDPGVFIRAARLAPRKHRAGPDALHLQTLYSLAVADCPA